MELMGLIRDEKLNIPLFPVLYSSSDGKTYESDYEKIAIPTIISVKENEVTSFEVSDEIYDSSDGLQKKEIEPLTEEFIKFMTK